MLQIESVLEPLKCCFYAPALVAKVAELGCGEFGFVEQLGHQDADLNGRRDVANQAHSLRLGRTFGALRSRKSQFHDHPEHALSARGV